MNQQETREYSITHFELLNALGITYSVDSRIRLEVSPDRRELHIEVSEPAREFLLREAVQWEQ